MVCGLNAHGANMSIWTGRGHTHSTAVYSFIRPTSLWQFTENNRFCPQASHYDPNRTKNPHTQNIRVTDRFLCIFTPRRYAIVICSSVYQTHNRCVALAWIVVHIECNNGSRSLTLTAVLWYFTYCYTVEIRWKCWPDRPIIADPVTYDPVT